MDESNIELKVAGGVLTIKGEKKEEKEEVNCKADSPSPTASRRC